MIKLYVDDEREAPEGWLRMHSISEALYYIEKNYESVSHIDFDYYLSDSMRSHTGSRLIRELTRLETMKGIVIFHQERGNYTTHSADSSMNEEMKVLLDKRFGIHQEAKSVKTNENQLSRLRKSKGRR